MYLDAITQLYGVSEVLNEIRIVQDYILSMYACSSIQFVSFLISIQFVQISSWLSALKHFSGGSRLVVSSAVTTINSINKINVDSNSRMY